ncbi:MAG TPA: DegT/DnrJ/EryC1/StrS family aminotransferase [Polyangiaceae bacterium]|nr:DegT/DnrJ/EryC1/StrS family aminotransferase [Polyangiaceae bacterium]
MLFIDLKTGRERAKAELDARIAAVLEHGMFIMGPEIVELEAKLAGYVGVKHAVSVSSGTHGLELALRALGVGPGDEVVTPAFSWISAAEVVRLVGATPVFVDIEPGSFVLDARRLEASLTPATKAIIPVSLFGQMPDFAALGAVSARHRVPLIEDAAQSFGASQHGRKSGGVSLIGCTSFFPSKPLGCFGDGGALFTDDDALATRLRAIRTHGSQDRKLHTVVGTNARLDTLQAAVLLGKLPHFDEELTLRARIGARYSERLRGYCQVPEVSPGNTHVYAQYTIRLENRDAVATRLREQGIPTAVYYAKCLHEQPVFAHHARFGKLVESERAASEVLSLPMHPYLTEADQDRVVDALKSAIACGAVSSNLA